MKKLLLTLGTVAVVAAPVASVIACGNNDSDKDALNSLTSKDLTERFVDDNDAIANATQEVIDLLIDETTDTPTIAFIKVLNFSVDGKSGLFDFTADDFLHNGLEDGMKVPTGKSHADKSTGAFDYVGGISGATIKIDPVKGLTVDTTNGPSIDELTADDSKTNDKVILLRKQVKYLIRMAIAAKTDLHLADDLITTPAVPKVVWVMTPPVKDTTVTP